MPGQSNGSPDNSADVRPIPSQAEGEDPDEPENDGRGADTRPVPSQAEGDEQTIDKSLRQKEKRQSPAKKA
jgi:hypothetical protein